MLQAAGNPSPTITWTKLGSDLPLGSSAILTVVASPLTTGQYQCLAEVEGFLPVASSPAKLLLVTKPGILSPGVSLLWYGINSDAGRS